MNAEEACRLCDNVDDVSDCLFPEYRFVCGKCDQFVHVSCGAKWYNGHGKCIFCKATVANEWWNCQRDALGKINERFDELVKSLNNDTSHEEVKKFHKLWMEFIASKKNYCIILIWFAFFHISIICFNF